MKTKADLYAGRLCPGVLLTTAAWLSVGRAGPASSETPADAWDSAVSYGGRRYRAKWWTQRETPGSSDVWEDLGVDNVPIDASVLQDTELTQNCTGQVCRITTAV